ncbi:MAG: rRNA pseudouridine synthase [Bdellovibrionales bacterium]|nr:rRNA pseudouridine synthase [Bdellovibrionales bacterium]
MAELRLQKYIADCGIASRRKAEELIESGLVQVNGKVVTQLGTKVDPTVDRVKVKNRDLRPQQNGLLIFHKPLKVITSKKDEHGRKTVMDFLPNEYHSYFPVGRLDFDTTGLLLLTNDGELAEHLMHPRFGINKVYITKVKGRVGRHILEQLQEGIELEDGHVSARAKFIKRSERATVLQVSISVGRNRIVRRIFEHLGHPVLTLKRITHGPFELGDLAPGELQRFSERAYQRMKKRVLDLSI